MIRIHKLSITAECIKDAIDMIRFKEIYLKNQKVEFVIPSIIHANFSFDQMCRIDKYAEKHNSVVLTDFPVPKDFNKTDQEQIDKVLSNYNVYIYNYHSCSFKVWYRLLEGDK